VTLSLRFAGDFADVFEVRGQKRAKRGRRSAECPSSDTVVLRYRGLDGVERGTNLRFEPAPTRLDTACAQFMLALKGGEGTRIVLRVSCGPLSKEAWNVRQYYRALRASRHALRKATGRAASLEGSNAVFNELARRSMADLYMLMTDTPHGHTLCRHSLVQHGFWSDGIITALLTLWADPTIANGCSVSRGGAGDEQRTRERCSTGKILHEMRKGEMARLGEVPFARYYGSVDATPLFVMLAGEYFARTGDLDTIRTLWPNIRAALQWIDTYGDPMATDLSNTTGKAPPGSPTRAGRIPATQSSMPMASSPKDRSRCAKCRICVCRQASCRAAGPRLGGRGDGGEPR